VERVLYRKIIKKNEKFCFTTTPGPNSLPRAYVAKFSDKGEGIYGIL